MKNIRSYILLHIGLLIYSLSSIPSKLCSNEKFLSWNYIFFLGIELVILFVYALIWQKVLKKVPLVFAYANKGITVVWGLLIGLVFFNETISIKNIIGAMIIVAGIAIFSLGESNV